MDKAITGGIAASAFIFVAYILCVINSSGVAPYPLGEVAMFAVVVGVIYFLICLVIPGGEPKP